jgi:hypothetical protein
MYCEMTQRSHLACSPSAARMSRRIRSLFRTSAFPPRVRLPTSQRCVATVASCHVVSCRALGVGLEVRGPVGACYTGVFGSTRSRTVRRNDMADSGRSSSRTGARTWRLGRRAVVVVALLMGGSSVAYFAGCGCGDSTSGSCGRGVSCGGCDGQCGVHSAALRGLRAVLPPLSNMMSRTRVRSMGGSPWCVGSRGV